MSPRSRQLGMPQQAPVSAGADGRPLKLARARVETVLEEWVVEDRWWTTRPLRRRYFELALEDGRNAVVFRDLSERRWYLQRG